MKIFEGTVVSIRNEYVWINFDLGFQTWAMECINLLGDYPELKPHDDVTVQVAMKKQKDGPGLPATYTYTGRIIRHEGRLIL